MSVTLWCGAVRWSLPRCWHTLFNNNVLNDWQLLIDTLLQWEQWLKSNQMEMDHVKKLELKHCYLMYLMKKVRRCVQGMGLKITKFPSIMHLTDDILNFGVPLEVDTGSNKFAQQNPKLKKIKQHRLVVSNITLNLAKNYKECGCTKNKKER